MRIIDADALLEKTQFRLPTDNPIAEIYAECVAIARENIEEAPTIDAVSVVRCKDCKYRPDETRDINACPMWDNGDNGWGIHWNGDDNGFCYVGELKGGEE